jgi:4-amino-4-deoxy-L-arabinose transferase-like glycosyltransferase
MNKILISILSAGMVLISIILLTLVKSNSFVSFSDSAKYADIANNIVEGNGYSRSFTFFSGIKNSNDFKSTWLADWPPPVTPLLISLSFKVFGVSDLSLKITTILFFMFTLLVVCVFTRRMYGDLAAVLVFFAIGFNHTLLKYAVSGGTEIIFIFEIVLGFYLLSLSKKWANLLTLLLSMLMYLTRPQFFIFCFGFLIYYLLNKYTFKKGFLVFMSLIAAWMVVDVTILSKFNGTGFLYSVFSFSSYGLSNVSASDQLRGVAGQINFQQVISRLLYNLYNFYKALPEISNPYLFGFFAVGLFPFFAKTSNDKDKLQNTFKISVLFVTLLTFFVTALTVPFYRYIHPIIPLVYIIGVGTLVNIYIDSKYKVIITTFLILFFAVGQTVGIIFLDSRFERKMTNADKAPIYVLQSRILKDVTVKDDVIVTNLDTWGSWYGERKTIWFPLTPNHLSESDLNIDAIYLTSYKMDDENYYMGKEWREIFENPEKQTILPDYKFVAEYEFKAEDNYERENGRAVLLVRN